MQTGLAGPRYPVHQFLIGLDLWPRDDLPAVELSECGLVEDRAADPQCGRPVAAVPL